jgi:hypothetical protein
MVLIDLFDIHFDECYSNTQTDQAEPRSGLHQSNADDMEDDESFGNEDNIDEDDDMFLSEDSLTYERLLMLDNTIVKKGLTLEQLKAFPIQLYVKSLDGEGSCNICISDYETGEFVRKLCCNHKFHKACIDKWLDANITCPTCKRFLR